VSRPIAPEVERLLAAEEPVILVLVAETKGSTPRPAGTGMAVTADAVFGTVGGGRLEWAAIQRAREMIANGEAADRLSLAVDTDAEKTCGGRVVLDLSRAEPARVTALAAAEAAAQGDMPQVVLCGAGHVGRALVQALAPLPVRVRWVDPRPGIFPETVPANVETLISDPVEAVRGAEAGAAVVTMTFSHGLDYDVAAAALHRPDIPYVGLIGSATKRARFERWFEKHGGDPKALTRLVSPIGDFGVVDKRPEVIAAFVAAEVLRVLLAPRAPARRSEPEDALG
jgi:xanthine dehydrogenase accessory factor